MTMFENGPLIVWENKISSPYGPRPGFKTGFHNGIDFRGSEGTTIIIACHAGIVRVSGWQSTGFGWVCVVENDELETTYAHMYSRPFIAKGQSVKAGDVLGLVGNTGYSTGPHLHFGLRIKPWRYGGKTNGYSDPTYALLSVRGK